MLTPKQLDHYPDAMVELWARTEQSIIADMARRINGFDLFIPSAQWQLAKVKEMGQMEEYILQELAAQSYRSWDDLKALMTEAGMKTLAFDDHLYEAAGLTPTALKDSPALQAVLLAGLDKTNGLFQNLTNSAAAAGSRQFERALDLAYMQVTTGAFSHTEAIKNAIKQLSRGGLEAVVYDSGRVEHLDVAVRRAVLTGVNQTAAKLQIARADEMGCDLVEVTAHAGARPSHAVWQGGIYSRSGKSEAYENFEYATGYGTGPGLCGWNCRHNFHPYFEGISKPAYTQEELEQFSAKSYEYNGVKMTEYEATQKQRYIERQIRRWKREEQAMQAAGLPTQEAKAKVAHWNAMQRDFLKQTGLKRQYDREKVYVATSLGSKMKGELGIYSRDQIKSMAVNADQIVSKHISKASKWSGKINILPESHRSDGGKEWTCDISVKNETAQHILIHEHLHARSASYYTPEIFLAHHKLEEASVELMAQEICKREGISIVDSAYMDMVNDLREINRLAGFFDNDYDFATKLFGVDMDKRIDWLYNKINQEMGNKTLETMQKISLILSKFE